MVKGYFQLLLCEAPKCDIDGETDGQVDRWNDNVTMCDRRDAP